MSRVQTVKAYLQFRWNALVCFAVFILVFAAVFFLYDLPWEPLWYGALLCLWIGSIFIVLDLLAFSRRRRVLQALKKSIAQALPDLPRPQGLLEGDYQELLRLLSEEKRREALAAEQRRRDLVEYYTLWAHQIKTPIAAMRLVLQAQDDEDSRELLLELFKIEQYVEMVLQYLRVESPVTDLVLKRHSLDAIVRQAVQRYASLFIRQQIRLDYQELDCEVLTDEKWLVFVIGQVLSNALKYTKAGTISIYLEDRKRKILAIEDTGIGIAPEDLPRVFEPGFTGYTGRLEKKATGIGLYLCRKVLDKLSHTIAIGSEVGKGTKVTIGLDTVDVFDSYQNVRLGGEV
ncbi:MAG: sensor histidine kinase [Limnochordia bacterium]|jgi:signal transduction histidine kinase